MLCLILFTPQRVSDHRYSGLRTEQSNSRHQRAEWECVLQRGGMFRNNVQQGSCGFQEMLSISLLQSPFLPMVSRDGHFGFRGGKGYECSFHFLQVSFPSVNVSSMKPLHLWQNSRNPIIKTYIFMLPAWPTWVPKAFCPKDTDKNSNIPLW